MTDKQLHDLGMSDTEYIDDELILEHSYYNGEGIRQPLRPEQQWHSPWLGASMDATCTFCEKLFSPSSSSPRTPISASHRASSEDIDRVHNR